ncbi:MAG: M20/M25/M40 family metallo-hydrolase, partial [Rhodospirillales bacterium]|nr:M20/M25/M40 family metallo-hydrolase [Rhodospirillales bacterium]
SSTRSGTFELHTPPTRDLVGPKELAIAALLNPHMRRAATIGDLLDMRSLATAAFEATLEALSVAVVLVDTNSRILFSNQSARTMFSAGDSVLSQRGVLVAREMSATTAIRGAIARAAQDESELGYGGIGVPLRSRAPQIAQHSALVRQVKPAGILVVEPTSLVPVRGHRAHIAFTAVATGVQAHSSTGKGRNANWDLVPFLMAMRDIHERLRTDTSLQDSDYDPPFSDFNLVVDNHGTAVNVSVPVATARIKFRYSAKVDPTPILDAVRAAAERAGVMLTEAREGHPPELPADHPLVRLCVEATGKAPVTAPFGTDASELQAIAPCVVLGPSDIGTAHTPHEAVRLDALAEAVPLFQRLATRLAG